MILPLIMSLVLLSAAILVIMIFRTKRVWDKLLFLNLVNVKLALALTAYSVWVDSQMILDVSMAYGLIGFLASSTLVRFLLKGGHLR